MGRRERGEEGRERWDGRERGRWLQSDAADRSDEKIYGQPKTSLYLITEQIDVYGFVIQQKLCV